MIIIVLYDRYLIDIRMNDESWYGDE